MKRSLIGVIALLTVIPAVGGSKQGRADLYPEIQERIRVAIDEFGRIPEQRKEKLKELSVYVQSLSKLGKPVNLAFDGTDQEAARYDERCRHICREMLYLFSQVRK